MNNIGTRIKKQRIKARYSQEYVSDVLGINRTSYAQLENGKRKINSDEIAGLATLFGISTDCLIFGENEEYDQLSIKDKLLSAASAYFKVNLNNGKIISDFIGFLDDDKQKHDISEFVGSDSYQTFIKWLVDEAVLSNADKFQSVNNQAYLTSCFQNGQRIIELYCSLKGNDGLAKEVRESIYLVLEKPDQLTAICVFTDLELIVDSFKKSKFYTEIAETISQNFDIIFYVDILDNSYVEFDIKGDFQKLNISLYGKDFFLESLKNLKATVFVDDQQAVADFLNKDNLLESLKDGGKPILEYRNIIDGQPIYYRMRISMPKNDGRHLIFTLENINDDVLKNKETRRYEERNRQLIEILSSEYASVAYVDLASDTVDLFTKYDIIDKTFSKAIKEGATYTDIVKKYADDFVFEYDKEQFIKSCSIYNLITNLRDKKSFTFNFRSNNNGDPHCCEAKCVKAGDSDIPRIVVIGFADKNDEQKQRQQMHRNINNILNLANNLMIVYDVELPSGRYETFSRDGLSMNIDTIRNISNNLFDEEKRLIEENVYYQDRENIRTFLDRDTLLKNLDTKKEAIYNYRQHVGAKIKWFQIRVVKTEREGLEHVIIGIYDINEQIENEKQTKANIEKLTETANVDSLTHVKNRNAYDRKTDELNMLIKTKEIDMFAVIVCDINDLKKTNDLYGHEKGDELIKEASRIVSDIYKHSPVYRIGGDEFVVIATGSDYKNRDALLKKINSLSKKNQNRNKTVVACGMSIFDTKDDNFETVFKRADNEMYKNKIELKNDKKN